MKLRSNSLRDGQPIDHVHAFCIPTADPDEGPVEMGRNMSPHLAWEEVPEGTRSFAVLCVDTDVPADGSNANQEGRTIPYDAARQDFYHWVLVDISPARTVLAEAQDSNGVTPRGKETGPTPHGLRGRNSYTEYFAGDADIAGTYAGYDGPCPPWNDERIHHYHFTVYALDVPSLGLENDFSGDEVQAAIKEHVLAEASIVGTYTLNPDARL